MDIFRLSVSILFALLSLPAMIASAQQPADPSRVRMFEEPPTLQDLRAALMPETFSSSRALGPKKPQPRRENQEKVVGLPISFPPNSAAIPDRYYAYIDRIGELMQVEPDLALRVEGHTDA